MANDDEAIDAILRHLGLDPERFRTECGFLNHRKVIAALTHPDEYAGLYAAEGEAARRAEMMRNDARYRWLRDNAAYIDVRFDVHPPARWTVFRKDMDASLDKAIAQEAAAIEEASRSP